MDGEASLEDTVLHPAHEQLLGGCGAGKAADVRAFVGLAGQTHAGDDGDIVLQALPAGVVVAAPGLGVALDTGAAAAADHVGACLGVVLHHGIGTHLAHQVLIRGFSWPMVPPLPSKSQVQSLSIRLSYSQLSFQTESVPTAMMDSVRYFSKLHGLRAW